MGKRRCRASCDDGAEGQVAACLVISPHPGPLPEGEGDLWQGQAPVHPFCPERMHCKFRWWSDDAAGKITDLGAASHGHRLLGNGH